MSMIDFCLGKSQNLRRGDNNFPVVKNKCPHHCRRRKKIPSPLPEANNFTWCESFTHTLNQLPMGDWFNTCDLSNLLCVKWFSIISISSDSSYDGKWRITWSFQKKVLLALFLKWSLIHNHYICRNLIWYISEASLFIVWPSCPWIYF